MAADRTPPPDDDKTTVRRIELAPRPAEPAPTQVFRPPTPTDDAHLPGEKTTAVRRIAVPDGQATDIRRIGMSDADTPLELTPVDGGGPFHTPSLVRRLQDVAAVTRTATGQLKRAWDPLLERAVARKVVDPDAGPEAVERLAAEARTMARLDHPGVLPVHDFVKDGPGAWFSMKFAEGRTLDQVLAAPGFDPADERTLYDILRTFGRACEAVAFTHSRGILHCDLKPSSILTGSHGQVYVTDWGSAQRLGEPIRSQDGLPPGTPAWMAPEQAQARVDAIDVRTDVFGLGAILFRILTGRAPHAAATPDASLRLARSTPVAAPQELVKDRVLPRRLCEIASRALSFDAAQRQASVEQLHAEVEAFLRGDGRYESRSFLPGSLVIREGDPGDAAYVIAKGRARAFKLVDGDRQFLREMGPGDVFGETAIFSTAPRTANVEAIDALTVTVIQRTALDEEMGRTFWMGYLVKALADRFRDVDDRATKLAVQHELDALALETWQWLTSHPAPDGSIARATPWHPLRVALCRKLKRTGPEVALLVQRLPSFALDLERDLLLVR